MLEGLSPNAGGRRKVCSADTSLSCANDRALAGPEMVLAGYGMWHSHTKTSDLRDSPLDSLEKRLEASSAWDHRGQPSRSPRPRLPAAQVQSDSSDILLRALLRRRAAEEVPGARLHEGIPKLRKYSFKRYCAGTWFGCTRQVARSGAYGPTWTRTLL